MLARCVTAGRILEETDGTILNNNDNNNNRSLLQTHGPYTYNNELDGTMLKDLMVP